MTRYKKGEIVIGRVTGIEKYGIFVSLDDYSSGLIHISEISDSFVRNPADYVNMGENIKAVVIGDEDSFHIKLSIKDIDYRFTKENKRKITETAHGFSTLGMMLPKWIEEKENEISKKSNL